MSLLATSRNIINSLLAPDGGKKSRKMVFKKRRSDMVLRQMKFLQEQFSIYEERLAFSFISNRHKSIKRGINQIKNNLLKMIPTRQAYAEWPKTANSIKD